VALVSSRRGRVSSPTINEHIMNGARPEPTLGINVVGCWEALAGADLQIGGSDLPFRIWSKFYHGRLSS